MTTRARLAAVALLFLEGAFLGGCGRKAVAPPNPGPPEVGVVTLREAPVALTTELPGRTAPYLISDVRPQVNGIVRSRLFQEGSFVRAGQVLYQIDPSVYRAAVDQARGTLANAEAALTTARLRAERYADLVKINAVSRQDYDDARAAYGQAQATVQQDRAALESALINLGYTKVRAPISGRIGISAYTPGALVTASQANALTTIQALDPIYVNIVQSSAELLALKRDMAMGQLTGGGAASVTVRLVLEDASSYPLEGRLQFTDVTVDPNSGAVTLRAIFPNPRAVLLPGMYVRAIVTEGVDPHGILAPQQGVARDPKGDATALVVGPDGKVQMRSLEILRSVGNQWLVSHGLNPGDRLIIEGVQKARPGQVVRVVPAGSAPQSGGGSAGGAPGTANSSASATAAGPSSQQARSGPPAQH